MDRGRDGGRVLRVGRRQVIEPVQLVGFLLREIRADPDATRGLPPHVTPLALAMCPSSAIGGGWAGQHRSHRISKDDDNFCAVQMFSTSSSANSASAGGMIWSSNSIASG